MNKLVSKFLYLIIALLVMICVFILLCAANPDLATPLKETVADIAAQRQAAADAASAEAAPAAATEASSQAPEIPVAEAAEGASQEEAETEHPYNFDVSYEDYVNKWNDSTVNDKYRNNPEYQEFVDAFLHPVEETDVTFPEDSSHMLTPQPDIFNVEDEAEARRIMAETLRGETGSGLEFDPLYFPYYQMLNDRGKALYRQIYANAAALNKKFAPLLDHTTDKEIADAFQCVLCDHPELFWVDISYYYQYDYKGNVIEFDFNFYKNFADIPAARQEFESTAQALASGAKDLATAHEKEQYIHDLIVDKLSYKFNPLDQSAYSSVVQDKTVCAGYARCFQYLMQLVDVPTYFCYGWGGNERHAWNIILLEDGYHNVDCTWDDSLSNHDFYNLSDAENNSHRRMEFATYLPRCVSSDYRPVEADIFLVTE